MLYAVYRYPERGFQPAKELEVGKRYEVTSIDMGQWFTYITLDGFGRMFNSVHFDFYEDDIEIDIYSDQRYNPYLQKGDD